MTDSTYNSSVQFLPNFGTNCSFEVALGQNQSVNKIPCIIMCIQFCLDSNHFVYRRRISLMLFFSVILLWRKLDKATFLFYNSLSVFDENFWIIRNL